MRLVIISDTHCQHEGLTLPDGDVLIHCGDFTGRGSVKHTVEFLKWFELQPHKHKLFISGNHDFLDEQQPKLFKDLLENYTTNVDYLNDSGLVIDGISFWGSPVSPEFCNWAFNRNQIEINEHWDKIPDDTQVLITHCPPHGILDKLGDYGSEPGANVGCPMLKMQIETRLHNLKVNCFGHIHEGYGIEGRKGKIFVNASVLNERYQLTNKPVEVEIHA